MLGYIIKWRVKMQFLYDIWNFFNIAPDATLCLPPLAIAALAGAALGLGKNLLVDKPDEAKSRKERANALRQSPWLGTSIVPEVRNAPNAIGATLGGGIQGLSFGLANQGGLAKLFQGAPTMPEVTPDTGGYGLGSVTRAPSLSEIPIGAKALEKPMADASLYGDAGFVPVDNAGSPLAKKFMSADEEMNSYVQPASKSQWRDVFNYYHPSGQYLAGSNYGK